MTRKSKNFYINEKKALYKSVYKNNLTQYKFLRFPEFDEKLINVALGEISEFQKGNGLNLKSLIKNGKNKCIHYSELLNYNTIIKSVKSKTNDNGSVLSSGNDVLISASFHSSKIQPFISLKEKNVILGSDMNVFKVNDTYNSDYVALYLSSNKIGKKMQKLTEGSIVNHIYGKYVLKMNVFLSENKNEQNKIVIFFTRIFEKIEKENKLKNIWKLLLKSLNEKIFEKNKDINKYYIFNDEIKKFFSFFTGLENNTVHSKEKYKNKLLPYAIVRDKTICDSKDLISFIGKGNPKSILNNNDILFISDSGYKNIGINSIYSSNVEAFLSRCCIGMRLKQKFNNVIYPKYINALFSWNKYSRKVKSLATGSVIYGINAKKLENIKIKIPNFETQIKISKVYYDTNRLIEIQTKLIQKIELFKKYFLDSMF